MERHCVQMFNVQIGLIKFYFSYFCLFYFALVQFSYIFLACFPDFYFYCDFFCVCPCSIY